MARPRNRPIAVVLLDRLAIVLSGVCLVHCLAIPLALVVLPALGSVLFESHSVFHAFLLVFGLPVSVIALLIGFRRHGETAAIVLGATAFAIMVVGITHLLGDTGELAATVIGAIVLTAAHLLNMRATARA